MKEIDDNTIDSCISDFPYNLSFMGRKWDTSENFYEWCKPRAKELYRILKPGGYALIFGHHKSNHRMKCAFEDEGFSIVEEIDWVYLTGFPKNQDIGKMFDKKAGAKREVIGKNDSKGIRSGQNNFVGDNYKQKGYDITAPATELAHQWHGWKTAGLKPAKEIISVFQKPLEGTYCDNIEKWNCGAMNIDACRVGTREKQQFAGAKKRSVNCYVDYFYEKSETPLPDGRFPPNIIFDEYMAQELDKQTGVSTSSGGRSNNGFREQQNIYGSGKDDVKQIDPGFGDSGGGSRIFPIIKYCTKVSPKERKLPNGERNPHVTLKPVELIKWLIRLVTPKDGTTIDITAGSGTHAVAVEELNRDEDYNLKWINIELLNTDKEPYCDVAKQRIQHIVDSKL
jgi:site-specific DNA-methyltransferase (adenine-specific)